MDYSFLPRLIDYAQLMLVCTICGGIIYLVYRRTSPNTRAEAEFACTVMVLAVATAFIVSIIKGSFAMSIGLIGVMSIVRFRTAIKSPRQLLYLFVAVAVGIGSGAGEYLMTGVGTFVVALLLYHFPVMPFDLREPHDTLGSAGVIAKLSSDTDYQVDIRDVSIFLSRQNLPHLIKDASRTKGRTAITIHFYGSLISDVDSALLAMKSAPSLSGLNLEFELRNKLDATASA